MEFSRFDLHPSHENSAAQKSNGGSAGPHDKRGQYRVKGYYYLALHPKLNDLPSSFSNKTGYLEFV